MEGRKEEQGAEYPEAQEERTKGSEGCAEERGSDGKPEWKAKTKMEAERWKLGEWRAEVVICRGETAEGEKRLQMKL